MTIEGNAEIVIDDMYADVLLFEKCGKITLPGLTVGHTEIPDAYRCEGAVVRFNTCRNITVQGCNLYGCGAFGIYGDRVQDLKVVGSKIYDCSYTGIFLTNASDAVVDDTAFFDSTHSSGFLRVDDSKIACTNCTESGALIETYSFSATPRPSVLPTADLWIMYLRRLPTAKPQV